MAANFKSKTQADDLEHDAQIDASDDNELEQYGVWIKAGPEDIEHTDSEDEFGLESLSSEDIGGEALLTEEEEQLLGSLEDSTAEPETPISAGFAEDESPADNEFDTVFPPGDELGDLSDLSLDDFEDENEPAAAGKTASAAALSPDEELGNLSDLELDEDMPEIGLDGNVVTANKDLQIPEMAEEAVEFDVSGEILPGADDELDTIDFEDLAEPELEEELAELEVDGGAGVVEEPVLEEISDELTAAGVSAKEEQGFKAGGRGRRQEASGASIGRPDLEKIENELTSIKAELEELKRELSLLKQAPPSSKGEAETDTSGFLSEEEDETIALTGDELDNILNTADITEETVEETESPEDQDLIDFPTGQADIEIEEPVLEEALEPLELEAGGPEALELPLAAAKTDLLVDKEDIIPLDTGEETAFDELDVEEPEAAVADGMETIDLDETDELLGEILSSDDEILEEEPQEAQAADLEFEAIELDEGPEPVGENEELEIEEIEVDSTQAMEPDLELEEILDEEAVDAQAEDLELDIAGDVDELEGIEEEAQELADEPAEEMEDIDLIGLEEMEEAPVLEEVEEIETKPAPGKGFSGPIPDGLKEELKAVLSYMDHLLESLPEDKIQEFAQSEHFETYKKLFEELGLEQ